MAISIRTLTGSKGVMKHTTTILSEETSYMEWNQLASTDTAVALQDDSILERTCKNQRLIGQRPIYQTSYTTRDG